MELIKSLFDFEQFLRLISLLVTTIQKNIFSQTIINSITWNPEFNLLLIDSYLASNYIEEFNKNVWENTKIVSLYDNFEENNKQKVIQAIHRFGKKFASVGLFVHGKVEENGTHFKWADCQLPLNVSENEFYLTEDVKSVFDRLSLIRATTSILDIFSCNLGETGVVRDMLITFQKQLKFDQITFSNDSTGSTKDSNWIQEYIITPNMIRTGSEKQDRIVYTYFKTVTGLDFFSLGKIKRIKIINNDNEKSDNESLIDGVSPRAKYINLNYYNQYIDTIKYTTPIIITNLNRDIIKLSYKSLIDIYNIRMGDNAFGKSKVSFDTPTEQVLVSIYSREIQYIETLNNLINNFYKLNMREKKIIFNRQSKDIQHINSYSSFLDEPIEVKNNVIKDNKNYVKKYISCLRNLVTNNIITIRIHQEYLYIEMSGLKSTTQSKENSRECLVKLYNIITNDIQGADKYVGQLKYYYDKYYKYRIYDVDTDINPIKKLSVDIRLPGQSDRFFSMFQKNGIITITPDTIIDNKSYNEYKEQQQNFKIDEKKKLQIIKPVWNKKFSNTKLISETLKKKLNDKRKFKYEVVDIWQKYTELDESLFYLKVIKGRRQVQVSNVLKRLMKSNVRNYFEVWRLKGQSGNLLRSSQ